MPFAAEGEYLEISAKLL